MVDAEGARAIEEVLLSTCVDLHKYYPDNGDTASSHYKHVTFRMVDICVVTMEEAEAIHKKYHESGK